MIGGALFLILAAVFLVSLVVGFRELATAARSHAAAPKPAAAVAAGSGGAGCSVSQIAQAPLNFGAPRGPGLLECADAETISAASTGEGQASRTPADSG